MFEIFYLEAYFIFESPQRNDFYYDMDTLYLQV